MRLRYRRSFRQWPKRLTMTTTFILVSLSWKACSISKRAAISVKASDSSSRVAPVSEVKDRRMKNMPVSRSLNWAESSILQPFSVRKVETAATMPRPVGQQTVRT